MKNYESDQLESAPACRIPVAVRKGMRAKGNIGDDSHRRDGVRFEAGLVPVREARDDEEIFLLASPYYLARNTIRGCHRLTQWLMAMRWR